MFALIISSELGRLQAAILSVVSYSGKCCHVAELSSLILLSLTKAKVTYLKMDTLVIFLELCVRDLLGLLIRYNDI